ncbi:MAG: glycosyltransferase, partial [Nitrospirae bacterium]
GRAVQMNHGARVANSEILLFLHADCILPDGAFDLIKKTLKQSEVVLGAFDIRFNSPGTCYRVIERAANLRSRLTSVAYGDQGIFILKEQFFALGGFKEMPLMEDIEFCLRAKKRGKILFLRPPVTVSARRFEKEGLLYSVLRDWALALSYTLLGVSPERLVRYYRDVR